LVSVGKNRKNKKASISGKERPEKGEERKK
jgi:hypothetical protein